jgi:hypothetical protein
MHKALTPLSQRAISVDSKARQTLWQRQNSVSTSLIYPRRSSVWNLLERRRPK